MALFKTPQQLRAYCKGINFTNNDSSLPDERQAKLQHILPILGEELYGYIEQYYTTNTVSPDVLDPDKFKVLADYTRAAMANLMILLNWNKIKLRITDKGIDKITTTNEQPIFRWEDNNYREEIANDAASCMEQLWMYLLANHKDINTCWGRSEAYKNATKLFIQSGTELKELYPLIQQPHRTYNAMKPIMEKVEDLFIKQSIGIPFYNYLKTLNAKTEVEKLALEYLTKAIAHYSIHESCITLYTRITDQGFTVLLDTRSSDIAQQSHNAASDNSMVALHQQTKRDGDSYLALLHKHLNDNASATVFPIWYASALYKNPNAEPVGICKEQSGGIFMM